MAFEKELNLNLPGPLRPYQWQGVRFLLEQGSGLLADEMGLGKTVQVAVALSLKLRTGGIRRALVVAPASLRLNWERELSRWAPNLSVRVLRGGAEDRRATYRLPLSVLVTSYEQVRVDSLTSAGEVMFDIVVLDEAQRIKNVDSDTALACRLLRRNCSWALTGTPLENRVDDLLSVFRFVRLGLLSPGMSREEMHSAMLFCFLRRHREDVLQELPPIVIQDIPIELDEEQRQAYDGARREGISHRALGGSASAMLALITLLKQLCNFDPDSNKSAKMDALNLIIESLSAPNHKLLIFSQFVETLEWIAGQIGNRLPFEIFHGGLDEQVRASMISRFNNQPGPRALLMSLRAGGVGLNLQSTTHVVLFDRWWNPAVEDQAIHRAHRYGRDQRLHVYRFLVVDSVEERIQVILDEKKATFESYVESANSTPTSLFTTNDLARILQLDTDQLAITH